MANGAFDDLLPSPDEILLMEADIAVISDRAARVEAGAVIMGPATAWWGLTMALASVAFILRNRYMLPAQLPISTIQAGLGYGGTLVFFILNRRRMRFKAWQTQAFATVWTFAGVGLFFFNIGCALIHNVDMRIMEAFLCFNFGVATGATGAFHRWRWLLIPAVGWMASGFAMFFLNDVIGRQTVLGSACALFMMVPGLIMMGNGRKA